MTTRIAKTNEAEAKGIFEGKIRFIFRSEKDYYRVGDELQFRVIKNKKEVLNVINSKKYVVTMVLDCMQAPISKGYKLIGFMEM